MLTETAQVVSASGNRATVRTYRGEACSSCSASGACRALGGGKEMEVEVLNHLRAREGDRVELALPEASFLKASAATYLTPLIGLMGGCILGLLIAPKLGWSADVSSILFGGLGLVLSIPVIFSFNRKLGGGESYIPRITRILPPETASDPARVAEACGQ